MNDDADPDLRDDRATTLLRRAGVVEEPVPPHVWEAVLVAVRGAHPAVTSLADARASRQGQGQRPEQGQGQGPEQGQRRRRGWGQRGGSLPGWPLLLAGAAAGALLTWAGLGLVDREATGVVLASGALAPLADAAPAGGAEVVEIDGHHRLRVTLEEAPDAGEGYLEVWLLRPDVSGMVTLGVLEGESGEYLLPPGLDLGEYPVVDISLERVDGDPGHGGDSLVRGEVG